LAGQSNSAQSGGGSDTKETLISASDATPYSPLCVGKPYVGTAKPVTSGVRQLRQRANDQTVYDLVGDPYSGAASSLPYLSVVSKSVSMVPTAVRASRQCADDQSVSTLVGDPHSGAASSLPDSRIDGLQCYGVPVFEL
jgi:hypothetical protein